MSCLSDELLSAWVSGALEPRELAAAEGHAADCARCREIAIAMRGLVPRADAMIGAVGATIGRYRVVAAIGQGAMGIVLRGHDPVLERDVAIKMINAIATTTEQRERMLHEAKMLALIDHPNVVRVHDAGIADADEVFVAMEYVTGTTLVNWLAETPQHSLEERLEVLCGVGAGIAAIHAAGVVHRDIKPDNILVRGSRGVIVDFGLARSAGVSGPAGSAIAGTPRFLAPEVRGGAPASERADQFAWWTVVDDALKDLPLAARQRRALAAASARGRAEIPEQRFASMTDAVAALTDAIRPPRRRWLFAASAAVAAAAVAISIVAVGRARAARKLEACEASAERVRALWRDKREPIHRAFAATKTSFAATTFDAVARMYDAYVPALASRVTAACHSPPEDEPASITEARRRCLDKRAAELAVQLDDFARANVETVRQAVDGAWAMVEPACDDVRVLAFGPAAEPAMADDLRERGKRGRELNRTRKYDEGVRWTESLIADARKRGDRTAEVQALHLLGDLRTNLDQLDAAIDAYQQGLRVAETQSNDLDATKMLAMLAERHGDKNDPATAHRMVALARAKLERIGGENAALTAYLHRIDGHIFENENHCPEAQAELRKAIAAFEHAYGPDHPNVGMTLSELSKLECSRGTDALASATRALTIIERSYGPDHPNVGGALQNLAIVLADAGRFDDAHKQLVRADAIFTAALGSGSPVRIALLVQLGDVAGKRGDRDTELSSYRQAATLIEAAAGPDSPQASAIHARIGEALLRQSKPAGALPELERAVAIAERGSDREQLAEYRALLARARSDAQRDRRRARQH